METNGAEMGGGPDADHVSLQADRLITSLLLVGEASGPEVVMVACIAAMLELQDKHAREKDKAAFMRLLDEAWETRQRHK